MASNRSFKDYVADRFYNEVFAAIQSYTTDNYDNLDLRLYKVRNIGGIELSDIEVKFVSVNDLPDMKIEFDIVVEPDFILFRYVVTLLERLQSLTQFLSLL